MSLTQALADRVRQQGYEVQVRGEEIFMRCPFHDERNPSFSVHAIRGGKCFSCDRRFPNADIFLRELSRVTGVDYDPLFSDGDISGLSFSVEPESPPEPLDISALRYYTKDVERFLRDWGVGEITVDERRLCVDPVTDAECFPIIDRFDQYWGCVERHKGEERSRYHYPPRIRKGTLLLGENLAGDEVWVVEGVRDLCHVEYNFGVRAVALGTAIPTKDQLRLLKRFDHVVICLDNDRAGVQGAERILKELHPVNLSIVSYTGKDPVEMDGEYEIRPLVGR